MYASPVITLILLGVILNRLTRKVYDHFLAVGLQQFASKHPQPTMESKALSSLERLEQQTSQRISIETDETEFLGRADPQAQSPFFTVLPRELRDLIYAFATAPYEDREKPYDENAYYSRPDRRAQLKTDTALLRACRRAWLEANAMPMLQAEHSFYFYRAAPDARTSDWMTGLTDKNRQNFGHLHMHAQMYAIERLRATSGSLRSFFLAKKPLTPGDFQPRVLHVTIRHTDWYYWENEEPLRLDDAWLLALLNSPDLRSTHIFKLELETLDYKVTQLRPIVDHIKGLQSTEMTTHIVEGKPTSTFFALDDREESYTWQGPANINGQNFAPYKGKDRLNYHVVILTWRLRFPEYPNAFIPHLRRAPRATPSTPLIRDATQAHVDDLEKSRLESIYVSRQFDSASGRRHLGRERRKEYSKMSSVQWRWYHQATERRKEIVQKSKWLASRWEGGREAMFRAQVGMLYAAAVAARWEKERSLLSFGDFIEPEPVPLV